MPARQIRRTAALAATCALALAATALASSAPVTVHASPASVARGRMLRLSGSGWAVIEFCRPAVSLALVRHAPLANLPIATVKLRTAPTDSGTFSTRWVVPNSVHRGPRTIVATQHCESGRDGSTVLVTRTTTIRVRSAPLLRFSPGDDRL